MMFHRQLHRFCGNTFVFQHRWSSSWDRNFVLREYKAYKLDKLNEQLAKLEIDALPEAKDVETQIIRKVPLLRWNRVGSQREIENEINKRNNGNKSAKRLLSIYRWLCVPCMVIFGVHTWYREKEHAKHFDETFSNYIPYPYLRVRTSKMPFGDDQTLFFNPKRNYDPRIHGPRPLKNENKEAEEE